MDQGRLHGVQVALSAPVVLNLCFAYDTILYCQDTTEEASELLRILDLYAQASSQIINLDKSSMTFSPWTPSNVRTAIHNLMGGTV